MRTRDKLESITFENSICKEQTTYYRDDVPTVDQSCRQEGVFCLHQTIRRAFQGGCVHQHPSQGPQQKDPICSNPLWVLHLGVLGAIFLVIRPVEEVWCVVRVWFLVDIHVPNVYACVRQETLCKYAESRAESRAVVVATLLEAVISRAGLQQWPEGG